MKLSLTTLRVMSVGLMTCALSIGIQHGVAAGVGAFAIGGLAVTALRRDRSRNFLYAYTGTGLTDIFVPSVYGAIQANDSPDKIGLIDAGVIAKNELLDALAESGSQTVNVPLWQDLDASVGPNMSDATDNLAPVAKVAATSWKARNAFLNKVFGAADLTVELAKTQKGEGNPMTRIKNRFGRYWMKQLQYRAIAIANGIFAKDVATYASDMIYTIAAEVAGSQSAATRFSADAVVTAALTMGDNLDAIKAIAVHSFIYGFMVKQDLITFQKNSEGSFNIPFYMGKRVIIDDGLPVRAGTTSGLVYTTLLLGEGAFGLGQGTPTVPFEVERQALQGVGGGNECIVERRTWLLHPMGWDFTNTTISGTGITPTNADLALAANWVRPTGIVRKSIPMAFLVTN